MTTHYGVVNVRRIGWLAPVALLIVFWFFLLTQPIPDGDESVYIPAGQQLISGANPATVNQEHPPLAKYLIGLSQLLFFGSPRIVGGILASITFVMLFFFLKRFESERVATATMVLLMVNPLLLTVMSLAMLEVYWVSFAVLGLVVVVGNRTTKLSLGVGGMLCGYAVASKLAAIPFVLAILSYLAVGLKKRNLPLRNLPIFFLPIVAVYIVVYSTAIINLGAAGFLNYQLSVLSFHESGSGSSIIYSATFRIFEAPTMAFLGFTNYSYLASYVPHLFAFNTYWRPTAYLNPAIWGLTFPVIGLTLYHLGRTRSRNDALWLLLFVAGLSVTWLSPKFFLFYLDALCIPLAALIAKSIPPRILPAYLSFAVATAILLSLPLVGLAGSYQLVQATGNPFYYP